MKVIVGASDLWPTPGIASRILAIMISTDEPFGVRGPVNTLALGPDYSSAVEEMVVRIGERIGRHVEVYRPFSSEGNGRNWLRDGRMVELSTEVHAFFGPDLREGGTEHVVLTALRRQKPVTAYEIDNDGMVVELASDDDLLVNPFPNYIEEGSAWNRQ